MRTKYIDIQTRIVCISKQKKAKPGIHVQLEYTFAVHKKILQRLEDISNRAKMINLYLNKKAAI